jgi:ABC-type proline/glycine betaine transport system substrate-binding protein
MKNYRLLALLLFTLTACGVRPGNKTTETQTDSAKIKLDSALTESVLTADMHMKDTLKQGDSLILTFTVKNNTADSLRFCKWHTPFEPLMSKYLDVKDENGTEVNYKGAMAKRIMPPPEGSYIKVNSMDSLSTRVDLLKAYAIDKPAKYTVTYEGQNISGLVVKKSVTFVYIK